MNGSRASGELVSPSVLITFTRMNSYGWSNSLTSASSPTSASLAKVFTHPSARRNRGIVTTVDSLGSGTNSGRCSNIPTSALAAGLPILANAKWYLRVMFAVDDIDETLERLLKRGAQLVGDVVKYKDAYRLCYIRGPEGLLIGLAQELS